MEDNRQLEHLKHMIEEKDMVAIKEEISRMNEADLAEIIEDLDTTDAILIYRMLPKDKAIDVFTYLNHSQQLQLIDAITDQEILDIMEELYFDDMIDLLEEVPAEIVTKVLAAASPEERRQINEFLMYPAGTAGAEMTIEYLALKPEWTVEESMKFIRENGEDSEIVYTCYVVDEKNTLLGFVSLRELVVADDDTLVEDMMTTDVIYVKTLDPIEEVADRFQKYDYLALPVVDKEHRLTGIITFDDILEIIEDLDTENFHRMVGIGGDSDMDYLDESAWSLAKNRIPWLLILMISGTISAGIIKHYNPIIAKYIILTSFIPMITGTGGNTGSQSTTVVIRGLATGEIELKDVFYIMWKEGRVGLVVGVILSLVNFVRLMILGTDLGVSVLVTLTMIVTIILSKLLGAGLPILMKKLGFDPALMSAAIITTIIDALVLVVYFNLAALILSQIAWWLKLPNWG